jgi:hypothetical protein
LVLALEAKFDEQLSSLASNFTFRLYIKGGPVGSGSVGPGQAQQVVECPKEMVGRVIGRGGETIKGLQSQTGARIQIDQSSAPCTVGPGRKCWPRHPPTLQSLVGPTLIGDDDTHTQFTLVFFPPTLHPQR